MRRRNSLRHHSPVPGVRQDAKRRTYPQLREPQLELEEHELAIALSHPKSSTLRLQSSQSRYLLRRRHHPSVAVDAPPPLLTPKPSTSPEPSQLHAPPLADITDSLNEQAPTPRNQKEFVAVKALDTILEKPMDIVVRSRALAAPQVPESDGPKSRTVIQYLVLKNFKSYAGRQEVGPFHASFSSVVGPNGSGKSNVIDSLLFVFGFRASKMRQGKISALIHNSAAFPDLDHCEVEVHFQEVRDRVCFDSVLGLTITNVL